MFGADEVAVKPAKMTCPKLDVVEQKMVGAVLLNLVGFLNSRFTSPLTWPDYSARGDAAATITT